MHAIAPQRPALRAVCFLLALACYLNYLHARRKRETKRERARERERETDCRTNVHGADGAIHAHLAMWQAYKISIAFLFVDRAMQKLLF